MNPRLVSIGMAVALGMAAPAWANGKGRGHAQPAPSAKETGKRVVNEIADTVADELLDEQGRVTTTNRPPGLAKNDKMPPGLAKQGKTPPGWDKGNKSGWKESQPKESLLRRLTRGIFRKATKPPSGQPASSSKDPAR